MKFGTYTFPNVESWGRVKPRIHSETPLPDRDVSDHQDLGSLGHVVEIWGRIIGTIPEIRDAITEMESHANGVPRTFDFELESPTFTAIMLEPEFTRDSPNLVRYRVRVVQTEVEVGVDSFILAPDDDAGKFGVSKLG